MRIVRLSQTEEPLDNPNPTVEQEQPEAPVEQPVETPVEQPTEAPVEPEANVPVDDSPVDSDKYKHWTLSQMIETGDPKLVKHSLDQRKHVFYIIKDDPFIPVMDAIDSNNLEIVKMVADALGGIKRNYAQRALVEAIYKENPDIIRYVGQFTDMFNTADIFTKAASTHNPEVMSAIIEFLKYRDREISFEWAVRSGSMEAVKWAESLGKKPTLSGVENVLDHAITSKNIDVLKHVLSLGANVDQHHIDLAINKNNMAMVIALLEYMLSKNQTLEATYFTYQYAIDTKNLDMIKLVEEIGGYPNQNAFDHAIGTKDAEIVKHVGEQYLLQFPKFSSNHLRLAIGIGNLEMVKYIMSKGVNVQHNVLDIANKPGQKNKEISAYFVDYLKGEGYTLFLSDIVQAGNLEQIKNELRITSDPVDPPLLNSAIASENIEVIKFIGDLLAPITDSRDIYVDRVISWKNLDLLKYLDSIGVVPHYSSLVEAIRTKDHEIVKFVLKWVNERTMIGASTDSLHQAIAQKDLWLIDELIEYGARTNVYTLDEAIRMVDRNTFEEDFKIVKRIGDLSKVENPYLPTSSFNQAINSNIFELVEYVYSIGAKPNNVTLHAAHSVDNEEIRKYVIEIINKEISLDITNVELLEDNPSQDVLNNLMKSNYDLSKAESIFESRKLCDSLSEYSEKKHYDVKQFQELVLLEFEKFKSDHPFETELPENILNRIIINQSYFIESMPDFYVFMNSFIGVSDILNEALRSRDRKEVRNWIMQMSTKGPMISDHENSFELASFIPKLLESKKKKLEDEGMVEINEMFPEKKRTRFDAIKKLRNKINNQTRIPFTKSELKQIEIEENSQEYQLLLKEIEKLDDGQDTKDTYKSMMMTLINFSSSRYLDKSNFVGEIVSHDNFGIGDIPSEKINVEVDKRKYEFEILDKKDPLGLVVGEPAYSGCCFTVNDVSEYGLKESFINPKTGILVVYDDKGKFLAQSWIWLTKDEKSLVLDNVEFATWIKQFDRNNDKENAIDKLFQYEKQRNDRTKVHPKVAIQGAYKEFAKKYKAKTGLNILVGDGYDSLGVDEMGLAREKDWYVYKDYPYVGYHDPQRDVYTDAEVAYRLANWYGNYVTATNTKDLNNLKGKDFRRIHEIEKEHFDSEYVQPTSDIKDDAEQPGFMGVGVEDNDDLQGYLYGYEFITEDNLVDFDFSNMKCYSEECKSPHFLEEITKKSDEGKILYVANLAVSNYYRRSLNKILSDFLDQVRGSKYEYLAFEALSDSYKLLFKGDQVNQERLTRFGVELISVVSCGDQKCVLMRIR
ncbi:MAG: hypothetical protein ACW963_00330 [Candidatus Sifarchaeia archaeon]|jgi:hypothetical protein